MRPIKILVVEDDIFLGRNFVQELEESGYIVTGLVSDRHSALKSFLSNIPDLVIVDIELNDKKHLSKERFGGVNLVKQITKEYNTPCIYYTGHGGDPSFIEEAEASTHTGILIKTVPFLQVRITINSVISKFWEAEKLKNLPSYLYVEGKETIRRSERSVTFRIEADQISYIKYIANSIHIYTEKRELPFVKKNLQLKTFLKRYPYHFLIQISRDTIVNEQKIEFVLEDTDEVFLPQKDSRIVNLSIGKTFRSSFFALISKHKVKSN